MVHKNSLWNLFFITGDLNYYLEFRNYENQKFNCKKQNENSEFSDTQNDSLR